MEKEQSLQEMVLGQPHTKEQSWTPPYLTLYVKINSRGFPGGLSSSSTAGDRGSIPGQGTRFHMPQLGVSQLQLRSKILSVTTKTQHSQINFKKS